jgi:hypothetical protein
VRRYSKELQDWLCLESGFVRNKRTHPALKKMGNAVGQLVRGSARSWGFNAKNGCSNASAEPDS